MKTQMIQKSREGTVIHIMINESVNIPFSYEKWNDRLDIILVWICVLVKIYNESYQIYLRVGSSITIVAIAIAQSYLTIFGCEIQQHEHETD